MVDKYDVEVPDELMPAEEDKLYALPLNPELLAYIVSEVYTTQQVVDLHSLLTGYLRLLTLEVEESDQVH